MRAAALVIPVFLLLVLLLLACGSGHAEPEAEAQARAYVAKTCTGCHPGTQLDAMVKRRLEKGPLAEFLATHHVSDPAQRAAVSAYLESAAKNAPDTPTP